MRRESSKTKMTQIIDLEKKRSLVVHFIVYFIFLYRVLKIEIGNNAKPMILLEILQKQIYINMYIYQI